MDRLAIPPDVATRLHREADAARWQLSVERFAEALEASASKTVGGHAPVSPRALESGLSALHLRDLALACACADGCDAAWEHFVLEHRPVLYRAAEAIRPGGGRELADSLYAELFGVSARGEARTSLFRYFHGRSSLSTWLRAVLAQRHVDTIRVARRHEPLADESPAALDPRPSTPPSLERTRWLNAMDRALSQAIAGLDVKDRLRLSCYYAESMTLAEIGRALGEHEATVSRHLTRARRALRSAVERQLAEADGMSQPEIAECLASLSADAGTLDLGALINAPPFKARQGG